jgi:4-hydroxybenzoate polyprenyltransferase
MNAAAGAAFYLWLAAPGEPLDAAILFGSILLIHASIGSMNDYCDIDLDRQTKPGKPIVHGDVTPGAALVVSGMSAVAGTLLSFWFGWATAAVAPIVLAAGMAYNFWAKGTIHSWVPYAIFIPALPVWSFLAAGKFTPVVLLSFPLGALIALALNLANTLPDLAGDLRYGIQGLAHQLGLRRSLLATWGAFFGAIVLLALTPAVLGNNPGVLYPGVALGALVLLAMIADCAANRSPAALTRGWYLSAILAAILGGAWVASFPTG